MNIIIDIDKATSWWGVRCQFCGGRGYIREIGERGFHICSKCYDEREVKELRQQKLLQLNNDEEFMNNRLSVLKKKWMKEFKEKYDTGRI